MYLSYSLIDGPTIQHLGVLYSKVISTLKTFLVLDILEFFKAHFLFGFLKVGAQIIIVFIYSQFSAFLSKRWLQLDSVSLLFALNLWFN